MTNNQNIQNVIDMSFWTTEIVEKINYGILNLIMGILIGVIIAMALQNKENNDKC
jgi:ABC-type uncharacterized transport system permease subunit